jgi:hypothetical protein
MTRRWVTVALVFAGAARAGAQAPTTAHEARIDAVVARRTAVEGGASLIVPMGFYSRTSFTAAAGVVSRDSGLAAVGRLEVVSRFLLDPFREWPYGLSVGAGLGVTNLAAASTWRPYLACVLDLELSNDRGVIPAIQVGLGGGARLGISLRSAGRWR